MWGRGGGSEVALLYGAGLRSVAEKFLCWVEECVRETRVDSEQLHVEMPCKAYGDGGWGGGRKWWDMMKWNAMVGESLGWDMVDWES